LTLANLLSLLFLIGGLVFAPLRKVHLFLDRVDALILFWRALVFLGLFLNQ
jgi:hypothetical protein